jgi:hypothetical protein
MIFNQSMECAKEENTGEHKRKAGGGDEREKKAPGHLHIAQHPKKRRNILLRERKQ